MLPFPIDSDIRLMNEWRHSPGPRHLDSPRPDPLSKPLPGVGKQIHTSRYRYQTYIRLISDLYRIHIVSYRMHIYYIGPYQIYIRFISDLYRIHLVSYRMHIYYIGHILDIYRIYIRFISDLYRIHMVSYRMHHIVCIYYTWLPRISYELHNLMVRYSYAGLSHQREPSNPINITLDYPESHPIYKSSQM